MGGVEGARMLLRYVQGGWNPGQGERGAAQEADADPMP